MSLEQALELAAGAPGRGDPNPTAGAVVVASDGTALGKGEPSRPGSATPRSSRSIRQAWRREAPRSS